MSVVQNILYNIVGKSPLSVFFVMCELLLLLLSFPLLSSPVCCNFGRNKTKKEREQRFFKCFGVLVNQIPPDRPVWMNISIVSYIIERQDEGDVESSKSVYNYSSLRRKISFQSISLERSLSLSWLANFGSCQSRPVQQQAAIGLDAWLCNCF